MTDDRIPDTTKTFHTLAGILERIPNSWRHVPVAIGNSIGNWHTVIRVSYHENGDGSKVLLLHEDPVKTPKGDTK